MKYGALPPNLPPRLISRSAAAEYVGVSVGTFDQMVEDGRMPRPKAVNSRLLWDVRELDEAITALPHKDETNSSSHETIWDRELPR
jgi:excisionase family DNA binding protein